MMVAVALTVRGDVHEVDSVTCAKPAGQSYNETIAVRKQSLKSHGARDRAVIENQRDRSSRRQTVLVGACAVDGPTLELLPFRLAEPAHTRRLMRRQNRKTQAKLGEQFESFQIDGGFREPHSFRRAVKSFFEVAHAPDNLSGAIAAVGQGHDDVIVSLGNSGAVAGKEFLAFPAGGQERGVNGRRLDFQP